LWAGRIATSRREDGPRNKEAKPMARKPTYQFERHERDPPEGHQERRKGRREEGSRERAKPAARAPWRRATSSRRKGLIPRQLRVRQSTHFARLAVFKVEAFPSRAEARHDHA